MFKQFLKKIYNKIYTIPYTHTNTIAMQQNIYTENINIDGNKIIITINKNLLHQLNSKDNKNETY